MYILRGHKSGITQLQFSPDGLKLYSGSRKGDNDIVCWDLRNVGQTLYSAERTVTTNQRIYFDISSDGKYLISGYIILYIIIKCIIGWLKTKTNYYLLISNLLLNVFIY